MSVPDLFQRAPDSERFGRIHLPPGHFDEIEAVDVLERVPDLISLMTNRLKLLRSGGALKALVPFDLSYGAWQDATRVRAFNERGCLSYTERFWYVGWRDACFELTELKFLLSDGGKSWPGKARATTWSRARSAAWTRCRSRRRSVPSRTRSEPNSTAAPGVPEFPSENRACTRAGYRFTPARWMMSRAAAISAARNA